MEPVGAPNEELSAVERIRGVWRCIILVGRPDEVPGTDGREPPAPASPRHDRKANSWSILASSAE
jgi:hypothetical protein